MILFDFKCPNCTLEFEELVKSDVYQIPCPNCQANAKRAILRPPRVDMLGMGASGSASPESIAYFDRVHRQQAKIEKKRMEDHGDYGPRPGSD